MYQTSVLGLRLWIGLKYCQIDRVANGLSYNYSNGNFLDDGYGHIIIMESAKNAWKIHRLTTILLIPLIIYLFLRIIHFAGEPYQLILEELRSLQSILFILIFTVLGLIHMRVGVNEILEDYIHDESAKKIINFLISSFFILILIFVCLSLLLILIF